MWPEPDSPEMRRPPWAETARKFGWITYGEYWEVPSEPTGRRHPGIVFDASPFFSLLKKVGGL